MFKEFIHRGLALGLCAGLLFSAPAGAEAAEAGRGGRPVAGPGGRAGVTQPAGTGVGLPAADPAGLSAAELDGLLYMREEEKLARDVYAVLWAQWGLRPFQNLLQSEQAHMDAVLVLLERYGAADPAVDQAGVFTNPALQALYTDLVAQGSRSAADALQVGIAIETLDLRDLETRLAQTDQADLQQVYGRLQAGSENHLSAFNRALAAPTGAASPAPGAGTGAGAGYRGGRP